MITCPACQTDNRDGRRFCAQCGNPLPAACRSCGFVNEKDDRFCGGCGRPLTADDAGTKAAGGPTASAVAPLETQEEMPQRRQLTVLFCDLADSTALAASLDPEDLNELNRRYQTTCTGVVEELGGYVARYMGDGILCYFGYPRAHENDSELAIRAALGIQQTIRSLDAPRPIGVRVGVATGEVVVGDIVGEGASQESTAVGQTPNLAARLQGLAEPGEILVSATTRKLAGDMFEYLDRGEQPLKGIPRREAVWQVLGASATPSRFQARSGRTLAPMVGRKHERNLIEDCFQEAGKGNGQVILLCGRAGYWQVQADDGGHGAEPPIRRHPAMCAAPGKQLPVPFYGVLARQQGQHARPGWRLAGVFPLGQGY